MTKHISRGVQTIMKILTAGIFLHAVYLPPVAALPSPSAKPGADAADRKSPAILIVSFPGELTVYDPVTKKVRVSYSVPTNVAGVSVSEDGKRAFLCYANGDALLEVDLATGKQHSITGNIGWNSCGIYRDAVRHRHYLLSCGGTPKEVRLLSLDPNTSTITAAISLGPYIFPQMPTAFAMEVKSGKIFLNDPINQQIQVIDLNKFAVVQHAPWPSGGYVGSFDLCPDGSLLAIVGGKIMIINTATFHSRPFVTEYPGFVRRLTLSHDGKTIYAVSDGSSNKPEDSGQMVGISYPEGKVLFHSGPLGDIRFLDSSEDGSLYVPIAAANLVYVLNARTGQVTDKIPVPSPCSALSARVTLSLPPGRQEDPLPVPRVFRPYP